MKIRALMLAAALCIPGLAAAADSTPLQVEAPYARAVPPMARNSGAFMVLRNPGEQPVRVIGARSDVSEVTELHTHIHDRGVMRMRRVDFIEVPARGQVELKPGGYHVMLIGLKRPLQAGDPVHLVLTLDNGGQIKVDLEARQTGMGPMQHKTQHMKQEHQQREPHPPMQH